MVVSGVVRTLVRRSTQDDGRLYARERGCRHPSDAGLDHDRPCRAIHRFVTWKRSILTIFDMVSPPVSRTATREDEIPTLVYPAKLLKVADKTLYKMRQRAEVRGREVRGQWCLRRRDIDEWIAEHVCLPAARSTQSAGAPAPKGTHRP